MCEAEHVCELVCMCELCVLVCIVCVNVKIHVSGLLCYYVLIVLARDMCSELLEK